MLCRRCAFKLVTSAGSSSRIALLSSRPTLSICTRSLQQRLLSTAPMASTPDLHTIETPSRLQRGLFDFLQKYEDFIGLTAVKEAQAKVVIAEQQFASRQDDRREKQTELKMVQMRLKEIHAELDRTSRGEDRYLVLLTKEHEFVKREKCVMDEFQNLERDERTSFHRLSMYLRESHEHERQRGERTKYWSVGGTIIGGIIGVLGTTINNRMRMTELRELVHDSTDPVKVDSVIRQLTDMVQMQQAQVTAFVLDVKTIMHGASPSLDRHPLAMVDQSASSSMTEEQLHSILTAIKGQETLLDDEMETLKRMIAVDRGYTANDGENGTIVYVGPEMSSLLSQSMADLEWRLKLQTLVQVVAVYGGLAILLPVCYAIFKGQ